MLLWGRTPPGLIPSSAIPHRTCPEWKRVRSEPDANEARVTTTLTVVGLPNVAPITGKTERDLRVVTSSPHSTGAQCSTSEIRVASPIDPRWLAGLVLALLPAARKRTH